MATGLLAKSKQLLFRKASLQEGARVNARSRVSLHIDEVAPVIGRRRVPEMPETDIVERRR